MSVTSGINAIAHAVEALYAPRRATRSSSLMAEEGVRALAEALPRIVADGPTTASARSDALYGAWLCGAALGASTMALHHKLCHTLGGTLQPAARRDPHRRAAARAGLQRSPTHPRRSRRCPARSVPRRPRAIALATSRELGAPRSLAELGMQESDVERIAEEVTSRSYGNPRPITRTPSATSCARPGRPGRRQPQSN